MSRKYTPQEFFQYAFDGPVLVARQLYECEQLKRCRENGGQPIAWEPEKEHAAVIGLVKRFQEDPEFFRREHERMLQYRAKLPERYESFLDDMQLTKVALNLLLRQKKKADPGNNTHDSIYTLDAYIHANTTANGWRHGKKNPDLSSPYFEVRTQKDEIVRHLITEEKRHLLVHPVETEQEHKRNQELRQTLGEVKYEQSKNGQDSGKITLFTYDPPGNAGADKRLAVLAGVGFEHIAAPAASSAERVRS